MKGRRSRASLHPFTHIDEKEFRESVSNPKNWSGKRFKTRISPATDLDVVEAYYRNHFASSKDKPSEETSDARNPRLLQPRNSIRSAFVRRKVRGPTLGKEKSVSSKARGDLAQQVERKLGNPKAYPLMSVEEVAFLFDRSVKTIYRWRDEGKLASPKVGGRILTRSVKALLRKYHPTSR